MGLAAVIGGCFLIGRCAVRGGGQPRANHGPRRLSTSILAPSRFSITAGPQRRGTSSHPSPALHAQSRLDSFPPRIMSMPTRASSFGLACPPPSLPFLFSSSPPGRPRLQTTTFVLSSPAPSPQTTRVSRPHSFWSSPSSHLFREPPLTSNTYFGRRLVDCHHEGPFFAEVCDWQGSPVESMEMRRACVRECCWVNNKLTLARPQDRFFTRL